MKRILIVSIFLMALAESAALAQQAKSSVEIDYNQPKTYVVGGIKVSGNRAFAEQQIINQSGLRKGMTVTVPSEDISAVVNRLWLQRYSIPSRLPGIPHFSALTSRRGPESPSSISPA